MKVLLVSDPLTDKAAASMNVHTGFMHDPKELPGLAHFLEHMLFLGTEKYPSENEYMKYLSEHGGGCNAYTSIENTNYFFDIVPENFSGILDRFSQFFISPLFTPSATERELNAVDSEHEKNISQDNWRLAQLQQSTSNPDHDFNKFGTGNKITLWETPKSVGINVRDELLKFHDTWYSSNIMGLCMLGKESLDELEEMAVKYFSGVKNKDVEIKTWNEHPFGEKERQLMAKVVPIKDLKILNITFPLPDVRSLYKTCPVNYVSHLLAHEGEGSLLSDLKARGWVNSLVGGYQCGGRGFAFFEVNIQLTDDGLEHVNDIITRMFQFLYIMRESGPQEWVFNEVSNLLKIQFDFKDKDRPISFVQTHSDYLHRYPLEDILSGGFILTDYNPEAINMIMSYLIPENIRVAFVWNKFEGQTNLTEKWYGTNYNIEKIPQSLIQEWKDVKKNPEHHLPAKNEFVPEDLNLVDREEETSVPVVIRNNCLSRIWYKQDTEYLLPKAVLHFEFFSPIAYLDPLRVNLVHMFAVLLTDSLTEFTYPAECAGLYYNLHSTQYGLSLSIRGYSEKQVHMLAKIIDKMTSFEVDEKRFDLLKESYVRALRNFTAEQPYIHANFYSFCLLEEKSWTKQELLEQTTDLTAERLRKFIPELLSELHIESLIHGNITKKKAEEIANLVENKFVEKVSVKPVLPIQLIKNRQFNLPPGSNLRYECTNSVHPSSCVEVYYQYGVRSIQRNALIDLVAQIMKEPCFDVLRTKEQLGYIVFSGVKCAHGVEGVRVLVQSDRKTDYVDGRIECFLVKFKEQLLEMSDEEFERHKNALAAKNLEKPKQLVHRSYKYWNEIMSQEYFFTREQDETEYLRTIQKQQVIDFFDENLSHDSASRRKLAVHVTSTLNSSPEAKKDTNSSDSRPDTEIDSPPNIKQPEIITSIIQHKSSLGLYPRPLPTICVAKPTKSKL